MTSNGHPVLVPQPFVQGERGVNIPSPYLAQASVFYTPHFFPAQHFAAQRATLQQYAQVSPLLQLHANSSLPREMHTLHNGPGDLYSVSPDANGKEGAAMNQCSVQESVIVSNPSAKNRRQSYADLDSVSSPSPIAMPALSPLTAKTPSSPGTPQQAASSPDEVEICVICSDKATGHHYGVTSCEGCKGFFKRSVQNKKVYSCRNLTQDCPVDKRHRNRCQFCRLQKCIKAGMLKEGQWNSLSLNK